ncbi:Threonine/homoserine/homoserine lactone efflux protein [Alteromonadaceae bacterium Bs31]|nr:Threonine/homoserine/homoserine lactone efflux protein [Alteromonadaceae bacterium Bs31]
MYEFFVPAILFSLTGAVTPGPNTIMLMSNSLNYGVRLTLPAYLGVCLGFTIMFAAIALGLGALFVQFIWLHTLVKIVGGVYLLFLAWKIANSGRVKLGAREQKPITFFQAAAFQWVNPKAVLLVVGSVATFTSPGENILLQSLVLCLIFLFAGLIGMAVWVVFGSSMRRFINTDKKAAYFNGTMAALLVIAIVPLLLVGVPRP